MHCEIQRLAILLHLPIIHKLTMKTISTVPGQMVISLKVGESER